MSHFVLKFSKSVFLFFVHSAASCNQFHHKTIMYMYVRPLVDPGIGRPSSRSPLTKIGAGGRLHAAVTKYSTETWQYVAS